MYITDGYINDMNDNINNNINNSDEIYNKLTVDMFTNKLVYLLDYQDCYIITFNNLNNKINRKDVSNFSAKFKVRKHSDTIDKSKWFFIPKVQFILTLSNNQVFISSIFEDGNLKMIELFNQMLDYIYTGKIHIQTSDDYLIRNDVINEIKINLI